MTIDSASTWMLLQDGANKVANQRLSDLNQRITTTVSQFHDDASAQVEGLEGESEEGLGNELFKALTDVMMVAFPEEAILEKVAGEAIKGFRDTFIAAVTEASASSAQGRLAEAKDELRRVLNDLVAAARDGATSAWQDGTAKVPGAIAALFTAHPEYRDLPFDDRAQATEEWLSDQIGIAAAGVADPSASMLAALWDSFHHDLYRISARTRWAGRDHTSRLQFLADMDPSQRDGFLTLMGEDASWWAIDLQNWLSGNTGGPAMHQ